MTALDKLGATTSRVLAAMTIAAVITVCGNVFPPSDSPWRIVATFLGGAFVAISVASWQLNAVDRARATAMREYWDPFISDTIIVLPSLPGDRTGLPGELSTFTPYHDAVAGYKVEAYLRSRGGRPDLISAADVGSVQDIRQRNVIAIGGPNLSHVTTELMSLVWQQHARAFFHFSTTLAADPKAAHLVTDDGDHLIQPDFGHDHTFVLRDVVRDLTDGTGLIEPRGMCLRLKGLLGRNRFVLVIAGVDTAYGTLAAADYVLTPEHLRGATSIDSLQLIVGARYVASTVDAPECVRVAHGS